MAITTVAIHKPEEYTSYKENYSLEQFGFNLKLLEGICKGHTDGVLTKETEETPDGIVQKNIRTWTNLQAAEEWAELTNKYHPTGMANVVVS